MSLDLHITAVRPTTVLDLNITHNLARMAHECGLYDSLWGAHGKSCADLIEPLKAGFIRLQEDRARLVAFNPANGWGDYDGLFEFTRAVLDACIENPDGIVGVSR